MDVDVEMEEMNMDFVDMSETVFAWMRTAFPDADLTQEELKFPVDLTQFTFSLAITEAYHLRLTNSQWKDLYSVVTRELRARNEQTCSSGKTGANDELDMLERAFTANFVGDAHAGLFEYIGKCWDMYVSFAERFCYPYIAIVQSSGFGKSRLLRECARLCAQSNHTESPPRRVHLLYVCARNVPGSTGFPVETTQLREYLFPRHQQNESTERLVNDLTDRLVKLFDFVMQAPPVEMNDLLFRLFTRQEAAQRPFCDPPSGVPGLRQRDDTSVKVLIVAIDEARALLPTEPDAKNIGWFRCFRRALAQANKQIEATYGSSSGVFGIVVDTNSRVSNFVPSARMDPSKRSTDRVLFPPFVLTDTIDVFFNNGKAFTIEELKLLHKERVLLALNDVVSRGQATRATRTSWIQLCELGRPLWGSRKDWRRLAVINIAAEKLVGGKSNISMTFAEGLGGVASVMCRLGIRPYMSTPLATDAVADYMAVLSYVSLEREQFFVSYSSDPILTLGATQVWHSCVDDSTEPNLSKFILPQLNVVLHQEVLDTGGIGEFVARIVLLLAMDACAVLETGKEYMRWQGAGDFYPVLTFLRALEGTSVTVRKPTKGQKKSLAEVREAMAVKWKNGFVSFTHFVQLSEEPTETCLWGLLGRRAAAMLPRGHNGADIIIPICHMDSPSVSELPSTSHGAVSMALVQVKNHERGYSSYTQAVTAKLDPMFVFSEGNSLRDTAPANVLRLLLSLRSPSSPQHAYVEDKRPGGSFALCLFGLGSWSSLPPTRTTATAVEVVSPAVAKELSKLLGPWWRVADMISVDISKCSPQRLIESPAAMRRTAVQPLAATLVLNEGVPVVEEQ